MSEHWHRLKPEYLSDKGKKKVAERLGNTKNLAAAMAWMLDYVLYSSDPDRHVSASNGRLDGPRFCAPQFLDSYYFKQLPESLQKTMGEKPTTHRFLREIEAFLRAKAFEDSLDDQED